ncbi:MAG: UDP-N-acetylmuramoyl-L-alanyl-D-glutamate--2,6-diaminopimelate ligase [Candidatus Moranbacteria bacterium]|nr:UDP-N-acetylmuramoyl-L-alanyl-D-glutamate--2,6-diaminopimelate ligase [Candidatus Moranbacteria bacterium]
MHYMKSLVPQRVKNVYHFAQAVLANVWYGFPSRKLRIIGVTGTDGKTTTVQLIARIFEEAGQKVALASTINFKIGDKEWVNTSKYTTLGSFATQKFLKQAAQEKCDVVIVETGSHALDQYRVWGIAYAVAVITNVTREHLDYHKTMERYRRAKKRLFGQAKVAVVNLDMENPEEFLEGNYEKRITYSMQDPSAAVLAHDIALRLEGSTFQIEQQAFELALPGMFNVENALAAIGVGVASDISLDIMAKALKKVTGVPGRMEKVSNARGLEILIDYAVTPNALEKLYSLVSTMRPRKTSQIIAVLGACGERDRGKRPIMGEIVSSYADIVILTNEDPYHESPQRIISEIARGVTGKKRGKNYFYILNRKKAIAKALKLAQESDIIVITGKGAEETMAIGEERIPWNDKRVVEELLNA